MQKIRLLDDVLRSRKKNDYVSLMTTKGFFFRTFRRVSFAKIFSTDLVFLTGSEQSTDHM